MSFRLVAYGHTWLLHFLWTLIEINSSAPYDIPRVWWEETAVFMSGFWFLTGYFLLNCFRLIDVVFQVFKTKKQTHPSVSQHLISPCTIFIIISVTHFHIHTAELPHKLSMEMFLSFFTHCHINQLADNIVTNMTSSPLIRLAIYDNSAPGWNYTELYNWREKKTE